MNRLTLMLVVALALAACAPTDPGTLPTVAPTVPPSSGDTAPTQETLDDPGGAASDDGLALGESGDGLFSVTLTGALDAVLAGSGDFSCEGNQYVLGVADGADVLTFTMPPGTIAGEYTIGADDSTLSSYLEVGGTPYTDEVFGVFTLAVMPAAAGEAVSGSFDMTYSAGGASVNAVGQFDLLAGILCE